MSSSISSTTSWAGPSRLPAGTPHTLDGSMANEKKLFNYLKRVTGELQETRDRLRALESVGSEPVAIVGMSCRFPGGVSSP
ncbi:polyketide synthase docking domain-containing protein, partial [Nocardiopsis alba]